MDRGSLARLLLLAAAAVLFVVFGLPMITGKGSDERQPLGVVDDTAPPGERPAEQLCTLRAPRFEAVFSTRGGSMKSARMLDAKYAVSVEKPGTQIDLVTTTVESRMPLRTDLRVPGIERQQVPFNDLDWTLIEATDSRCVFRYASDDAEVEKTLSLTERPFEVALAIRVRNLAKEPLPHRLAIEQTTWRTAKEEEGSLGSQSEFLSDVVLHGPAETKRLVAGDFEPKDFEDEQHFTAEKWYRLPGDGAWAAAANSYFASTIIHREGPTPAAEGQVEERWDAARFPNKKDDPTFGHVYRARLAYPQRELGPGEEARYDALAFVGPKEREVLAHVGGGEPDRYQTSQLINLGWFGVIGRVLVGYVYWLHSKVGSWGWSIVLLTVTVKTLLFPLTLPQIKSSFHMRRLKPQMDELNKKYKDDATQRGLAMQELWRKEGVTNPMLGCLPVLLQMPVWIALYTALQTAVELYHTPFGPFMPDLSHQGKYYIIPAVLGASSFLQQRIMPPQGDPAQAKMMQYMMPTVYTVMMLFLPAGLGVYMITNTWLGIGQQVAVERWMKGKLQTTAPRAIEVREKTTAGDPGKTAAKDEAADRDDAKAAKSVADEGDAPGSTDKSDKKGKARGRGRDARVENG
jgi:YidC/Oxa1 family membrane protein insertase